MGTPAFSVPVLSALAERHQVAMVYSQPSRPAGRGQQPRPAPVALRAAELGLPIRHPVSLRDPQAQAAFAALDADIAVVVAYGLILPQAILDAPRHGCLNIHASLLPRWRGAAPIHRAILAGDDRTGIAIMQMAAGLDTGPVLLSETTRIGPTETTGTLHDRLSDMGARLILAALDGLEDLVPVPQPVEGVTYATKIDKSEARVDWTQPAEAVDRQIRGLSPAPGAWCEIGAERVKLLGSRLSSWHGAPGQVLGGMTIACGSGAVEITLAQRPGKRPMAPDEILRGLTLPERLG